MSEMAIQVKDLSKVYKLYNKPSDRLKETLGFHVDAREHYALKHVNFEIRKGETVGIIGTNGSGKSTILKIITGVLNPTGGEVNVDGRISALLELGAGFNMEYTGIENVYLNGTMLGFKTILFVSHDLGSITKYCDRAILLNQGEKIFEGTPKEAVDIYKKVLVHQFDPSELETDSRMNDVEDVSANWKDSVVVNPKLIEYGEKIAEITDYAILDDKGLITNTLMKGSTFSVRMKVDFHEEIKEPIYAFTIKNLQGIEITGTNTMYEKADVKGKKEGESQEITFTQKLDLQGGEYLISLGCTGYRNGEFVVFHRLYDVCSLTVISDRNTVGYYDMNSKVTLS